MIAVRVLSDLSDVRRTYYANVVYELEDDVAQQWIAAGWVIAEHAVPSPGTAAPPEAAARAAPPETATRPRAEKR